MAHLDATFWDLVQFPFNVIEKADNHWLELEIHQSFD